LLAAGTSIARLSPFVVEPGVSGTISKLDYSHYVCFPNDGQRHEIIEGEHYVNPAPSTYHQTVSRRIQFALYTLIELKQLGQVFNAPVDVQLGNHNIVQPDIVVILAAHQQIITPTKIKGIPDLIVEILSPSTLEHDQVLKRQMYEAAGVPEFWIVDPFEHCVSQLILNFKGSYELAAHAQRIAVSILPNVSVDLTQVG
jgi:Uma2 family endonuclease